MHEFASILRALSAGFKLERAYYWSRPTSTVHGTGHVVEEDRQPFRDMALCGQRQGVPVRLRLTGRIARLLHTIVAMSATPLSYTQFTHTFPQGFHTSGLNAAPAPPPCIPAGFSVTTLCRILTGHQAREAKRARRNVLRQTTPPRQSHEGRSLTCLRKAVVSEYRTCITRRCFSHLSNMGST